MKFTNALNAMILAGALAVPATFAQTSTRPQSQPPTQSSGQVDRETRTTESSSQTTVEQESRKTGEHAGHVAGAAGETSNIGKSDQEFITKAAQGSMMEIQLAQMAQEKAASEEVKDYAKKLEQDHKKANDQLKEIASERGVDVPQDLGSHAKTMDKFSKLSGEEFDKAYIRSQVKDHKKDIKLFQKQANRGMDSSVKEFAENTVPVLQEHLRMAQQLQSSVGTRARSVDTPTTDQDMNQQRPDMTQPEQDINRPSQRDRDMRGVPPVAQPQPQDQIDRRP
jgi:putative membrane protein